jgi:hypothetical protein
VLDELRAPDAVGARHHDRSTFGEHRAEGGHLLFAAREHVRGAAMSLPGRGALGTASAASGALSTASAGVSGSAWRKDFPRPFSWSMRSPVRAPPNANGLYCRATTTMSGR